MFDFFLRDMRIKSKLLFVLMIPFIGFVLLTSYMIFSSYQDYIASQRVVFIAEYSTKTSALIHEIQKERGLTSLYFGLLSAEREDLKEKEISDAKEKLKAQQLKMNNARRDFSDTLDENRIYFGDIGHRLEETNRLNRALNKIKKMRSAVVNGEITSSEVFSYYTGLVRELLHGIEEWTSHTEEAPASLVFQLVAYSDFLELKERAGLVRGFGAKSFAQGFFTKDELINLNMLYAEQGLFKNLFDAHARLDLKERAIAFQNSPLSEEIDKVYKYISKSDGQLPPGLTGHGWFDLMSENIDEMKKLEDFIIDLIFATAIETKKASTKSLYALGSLIGIASLISLLLLNALLKSITEPLNSAILTMKALAKGDYLADVPDIETKDEIGDILRLMKDFRDRLLEKKNKELGSSEVEPEED